VILLGKADPMITHQAKKARKVNVRTRLKIKPKHRLRRIARKSTLIRNK